jgi:tripartite-type tricarboxylate transporter receptor subunit TctC
MNDLAAGGVDIVTCSVPEARALIDAGRVRSLAVMSAQPSSLYPHLPTVKAAAGSNWTVAAWRGVAAPKGLAKDVQDRLVAAIKKAHDSREFRDFASQRGYGVVWAGPADFAAYMAKDDAAMGQVMKALRLAK